jgi:hypothetical protein
MVHDSVLVIQYVQTRQIGQDFATIIKVLMQEQISLAQVREIETKIREKERVPRAWCDRGSKDDNGEMTDTTCIRIMYLKGQFREQWQRGQVLEHVKAIEEVGTEVQFFQRFQGAQGFQGCSEKES